MPFKVLGFLCLSIFFFQFSFSNEKPITEATQADNKLNQYLDYLKSGDIELNRIAVRKLGTIKDKKAVEGLIKALSSKDYEVRFYAKKSLVKLNEFSIPIILNEIKNPNYKIRLGLVESLGTIKNKKATSALISTLKLDNNSKVRAASAASLGKIEDISALNQLIDSLKDRDYKVRTASARALGFLKSPRAIPHLVKTLKDPNSYVRTSSATALGRIKDKSAVSYLITALKDSSRETREMACWSLGKIKDKRAVRPLLHTLIKDSSGTVRNEAFEALKKMGYTAKQIDMYKKRR